MTDGAGNQDEGSQQLQLLMAELKRIEGQQEKLKNAIATNKPIIVHPRQDVSSSDDEEDKPQETLLVPSSGMGFCIATDLLQMDFSPEEEAPEEYRAPPFNARRLDPKPGGPASPSFGRVDPTSRELQNFLQRLEEQQRQVLKLLAARNSTSTSAVAAVFAPANSALLGGGSHVSTEVFPDPPVVAPALLAASSAAGAPVNPPEVERKPKGAAQLAWREPPVISMKFSAAHPKAAKLKAQPSHWSLLGFVNLLAFAAAFGLYLVVRITHTLDAKSAWLPYQILVLLAETLVAITGCLHALGNLRIPARAAGSGQTTLRHFPFGQASNGAAAKDTTAGMKLKNAAAEAEAMERGKLEKGKGKAVMLEAVSNEAKGPLKHKYHIQVLVYSQVPDLDRLKDVLLAAYQAEMPPHCTRVIYLVDPGRDPEKMEVVNALAIDGIVYMPGPETVTLDLDTGKAATLNRALRKIYPRDTVVKQSELVAVFDGDQIMDRAFFVKTVPLLEPRGVRLVHTPPGYDNLDFNSDLYMQANEMERRAVAGYERMGRAVAAPTNFIIRADALQKCEWFPTYCHDVGFAIGMELRVKSSLACYLPEVLATGIAPVAYSQVAADRAAAVRSRFQVYYRMRPPHEGRLSLLMRLAYSNDAWSAQTAAIVIPIFIAVPIIQIWFDVFPLTVNRWFGVAFVLYYIIATPLLYRAFLPRCARALWMQQLACNLLWPVFLAESLRARLSRHRSKDNVPKKAVAAQNRESFAAKMEMKRKLDGHKAGAPEKMISTRHADDEAAVEDEAAAPADPEKTLANTTMRSRQLRAASRRVMGCGALLGEIPLVAAAVFAASFASFAIGCWLLFATTGIPGHRSGGDGLSVWVATANLDLIVSMLWCLANSILSAVGLYYACAVACSPSISTRRPASLAAVVYTGMVLCWGIVLVVAVLAIALGHGFHYSATKSGTDLNDISYHDALEDTFLFYEAQRSGSLPSNNRIPWRGNSALADTPLGGLYEGGDNVKSTTPIALTAGFLAWSIIVAPTAYANPNTSFHVLDNLKWAADYLTACQTSQSEYVVQVGDPAVELSTWSAPETITTARPTYNVSSTSPGSDVVALAAAALAATSQAFLKVDYTYSTQALATANSLYALASQHEGLSTSAFPAGTLTYASTSYLDDLAYAAAWLYSATGEQTFQQQADDYLQRIRSAQQGGSNAIADPSWDNMYWATNVLLARITGDDGYTSEVQRFLDGWTAVSPVIPETPKGLSFASQQAPLQNAANAAFLALLYGNHLGFESGRAKTYVCWARSQIRYMVGATTGQSLLVGFGSNPPVHPAHRGASCANYTGCFGPIASSSAYSSPNPNPHVLYGALVAGPDQEDGFVDQRSSPDNKVAVEYTAGFTGAAALLATRDWSLCAQKNGFLDELGAHLNAASLKL